MPAMLEPFIERLQQTRSLLDLDAEIRGLRDSLKVEHIVYHAVNGTDGQYAVLTYSDKWVDQYTDQDYARIDPVVQTCLQRFHPVDWSALDWSARGVRALQGEARAAGLGAQGFSVPIHGPGGRFALFTVNHDDSDASWAQFGTENARALILMSHYINQKALEFEGSAESGPQRALSPREADVLTLLAIGRSRAQAADALSISEHTLRVYIESARHKLNASNTTHAVARALASGAIMI